MPASVREDQHMTTAASRASLYPIDATFLDRWSPRAFTGEALPKQDLLSILEAARWAPSSYNSQPWRFIYATRDSAHWDRFLNLLIPFNQSWAKDAGALIILVSKTFMRPPGGDADVPSYTHSLDAGAASGYLALQANKLGWYVHGMSGVDFERAAAELAVPDGYRVEAAYAVGRKGDPRSLPPELQAREMPSDRIPLDQLAFEGAFPSGVD